MSADGATTHERMRSRMRIGEWTADPQTNELSRRNEAVRIEPKAMDVLMVLAGRVGRVVSREDLFAAVWPGVVVGDEALTQSIIKLRKALGDDSRAPSYIETIAKRGYRLIATVRQGEDREAMSAGAARPEIAESTPAGAAPAQTAGSIPAEDIRVETVEPATAVLGPASPAPRLPRVRRYVRAAGWMGVVALTIALGGVYLVQSISRPATTPDLAEADGFRQPSWVGVTIVPFEYLGADSEQAYLARGISDNLVTDLSRLSGLRVIRDAGRDDDPETPGARYRVSGTVQRESGTLRLNIHLVDTTTHEQLWSEHSSGRSAIFSRCRTN